MRATIVMVWLSLVSVASADVVPAGGWMTDCPPVRCPPGSRPYGGSHGSCSIGCAPGQACEDDAECERYYDASYRCEPTRFCVQRVLSGNSANDVVRGECRPDDSCEQVQGGLGDEPVRCEVTSRCIFHEELVMRAAPSSERTAPSSVATESEPARAGTRSESPAPAGPESSDDGCSAASGSGASPLALLVFALTCRSCRRSRR